MYKATHKGFYGFGNLPQIEWDEKSSRARVCYLDGSFGVWLGEYTRGTLEDIGWKLKPIQPKYMVNK